MKQAGRGSTGWPVLMGSMCQRVAGVWAVLLEGKPPSLLLEKKKWNTDWGRQAQESPVLHCTVGPASSEHTSDTGRELNCVSRRENPTCRQVGVRRGEVHLTKSSTTGYVWLWIWAWLSLLSHLFAALKMNRSEKWLLITLPPMPLRNFRWIGAEVKRKY